MIILRDLLKIIEKEYQDIYIDVVDEDNDKYKYYLSNSTYIDKIEPRFLNYKVDGICCSFDNGALNIIASPFKE